MRLKQAGINVRAHALQAMLVADAQAGGVEVMQCEVVVAGRMRIATAITPVMRVDFSWDLQGRHRHRHRLDVAQAQSQSITRVR